MLLVVVVFTLGINRPVDATGRTGGGGRAGSFKISREKLHSPTNNVVPHLSRRINISGRRRTPLLKISSKVNSPELRIGALKMHGLSSDDCGGVISLSELVSVN